MKLKKLLASALAGVLTLSGAFSFIPTGEVLASAEETVAVDSNEANENVTVLYDAPLTGVELGVFELGKSIEGAKLRFTYKSNKQEGVGVVGVAGRAADDDWTWLQSESDPALPSTGAGKTSVVEMNYDEFVDFVDVGQDNIRSYIFQDWGLAKNTNFKIELITSVKQETVTEVYNDTVDYDLKLSPMELGKSIKGSMIRITYTSDTFENWAAVGLSVVRDGGDTLIESNNALYSRGEGQEVIATFSYNDFVNYLGIRGDIEFFAFENWRLEQGTNLKIELITPVVPETVKVVFNGKINNTELTPYQLGKNIAGAKIRITYISGKPAEYKVLGVSGKRKDNLSWVWYKNALCSKGIGKQSIFTFTYNDFVEYMGIGDDLEYFVFQDWGLDTNKNCKIELITPKQTDPDEPVDPTPETKTTVVFDGKIDLTKISPEQLGKGIEGAMLTFTYTSSAEAEAGYGVLGIAGMSYDWEWEQAVNDPAFVTSGPGETDTVTLSYDAFVEMAGIGDDLRYFVFQDWGLDPEANCKIELTTPVQYYAEMTLYDDVLAPDGEVDMSPAELGQNIPGAKIQFTYTSDAPEYWGVVGFSGKALDTWEWQTQFSSLVSEGECTTTTITFTYADFVDYVGIGDDLECFVFQNWGLEEDTNFVVKLLIPAEQGAKELTLNLYTGDLADDAASFSPAQLGALTPGTAIKITYTGAGDEGEVAVGLSAVGEDYEWYTGANHLVSVGPDEENTYTTTYEDFVDFVGIEVPVKEYVFQDWGLLADTECIIDLVLPVTSDADYWI